MVPPFFADINNKDIYVLYSLRDKQQNKRIWQKR